MNHSNSTAVHNHSFSSDQISYEEQSAFIDTIPYSIVSMVHFSTDEAHILVPLVTGWGVLCYWGEP